MSDLLSDLESKSLWKHFATISRIPRASAKEAAARDYVLQQAKRLGLEVVSDKVGNIVVRKPAQPGREDATPAVLQGHLDMVCEKNEGTAHNFDTDPIHILREGDWLKADGTTLGADNGIGVSAALAVMESHDIAHGPLEFLFTIDEESGLTGASEFPAGLLQARFFLNLDNEEQGTLCIGCSGGLNTTARRRVNFHAPAAAAAFRIKVSGLRGGHSGVDIHQGRGNALRVLGRLLQELMERMPLEVAEIKGGSARNAIPRETAAVIVGEAAAQDTLQAVVAEMERDIQLELGAFDPGLRITAECIERPGKVFDAADAKAAVSLLACLPHGVLQMSPDIPGLVQTSTNLATAATVDGVFEIATSQRSAIKSSILAAAHTVRTVCVLAGFEVESSGGYPGWKPDPATEIVRKHQAVYEELFKQPMKLIAMHAGLECGVIGEKYPGMQMVSFGPTIVDPHSPHERVQISTVESFWKYLRTVLERI
jgi:dipeptidase D